LNFVDDLLAHVEIVDRRIPRMLADIGMAAFYDDFIVKFLGMKWV
jgi:hypothetical protein